MNTNALHFTELHVRRAPGCSNGWRLADLSHGINIIFGPNASGKSTTARALTSVIWPGTAAPQSETAATFMLGGATWRAELYSTHAAFQCNDAPSGAPEVPAAETMHTRCNIALHDLLQIGDGDGEYSREISSAKRPAIVTSTLRKTLSISTQIRGLGAPSGTTSMRRNRRFSESSRN